MAAGSVQLTSDHQVFKLLSIWFLSPGCRRTQRHAYNGLLEDWWFVEINEEYPHEGQEAIYSELIGGQS